MYCEKCGNPIPDGSNTCPACGATLGFGGKEPNSETKEKSWSTYVDGVKSMASSIELPKIGDMKKQVYTVEAKDPVLSEGETVVKKYPCAVVKTATCMGFLTVTNKRVMFNGVGTSSRVVDEVKLDTITGINCFYGNNYRIVRMIIGAILIICGIVLMSSELRYYMSALTTIGGLVLMAIGGVLIYTGFKKAFNLQINSSQSAPAINVGGGPQSILGNSALYTIVAEPTGHTDEMLNELGALILDLQLLGDRAIEKWKGQA